jgi:cobalamin biosynthesis protein CobT
MRTAAKYIGACATVESGGYVCSEDKTEQRTLPDNDEEEHEQPAAASSEQKTNKKRRDHPITDVPKECAIKIFKTTLNEFKNRADYVKDDYRFKNIRKLVNLWADKERLNLNRCV